MQMCCSHSTGQIYFDDINLDKEYHPWKSYRQSKLANVLFSRELAKRLQGTEIISVLHQTFCSEVNNRKLSDKKCPIFGHRYWSNDIQPPPWSNPDWTWPTLLARSAPVEEICVRTIHILHQVPKRRGSDHHLLCCGGKPAEWKWTLLQVSQCKPVCGTNISIKR